MAVLRKFARPLLASTFVVGGYAALRSPDAQAPDVTPTALPLTERVLRLPQDAEQLVRITGAVQLGAGGLLALGRLPRAAALALSVSLLPAVLAVEPWWTIDDPDERARQRARFFAVLSALGGVLLAAADTHGKPSLAYRTRQGTRHAADGLADGVRDLAGGVRDRLPIS
ncbi:DoxX family membrane protein [Actinacidiphila paucisporea]|nr:DoxX family membrane protein [Actinacidiphila paucisporea]